ncbi:tetratricopeptide repeat protein [Hymenobacter sp. BT683]|uniref:Tetratricopeptide repeat protein n=1 Tax=Hymenobacter jeongseonensis TaxID=2791027 RepID=A0ABS0IGJ1_9BACT|nr:tetratricopeptide repeat protein [Hymenobacter jeongseonensis]MBF9237483.1 tetratricopeptide repeat protein [Hymenobacter jeongseonensis]
MTNILRPLAQGLLAATLFLSACTLPRVLKQAETGRTVVARPTPLTASGESVPFEVIARVPASHLHKGVAYELLLSYRYEHGLREDTVGRIAFTTGNYVYDDETKGLLVATQKFSLPNTPNRNPGELLAQAQVRELKKDGRVLRAKNEVRVTRGIADPARLVTREDTVLTLLPERASNNMSGTRVLPFYFDEGQWFIRGYLGTNVAALEDLIDANQQTKQVLIIAGHSPDSVDAHNRLLASKRVRMLLYYYKQRVKTFSYLNKVQDIRFDTLAYTRRWDTFLSKVTTSALKADQIDSIVSIINDAKGTFQQKEKALHRLSSFDYIEQYIYPVLRFGTVAVTYDAPKRYDSEVYLLAKKIVDKQVEADALTPEELRYSATLTPLLAEKQRIYETSAATTNGWEAFHNLGVVLLQRGEKEPTDKIRKAYYRRAAVNFTLAAHRNPTAEFFYHAATAYHRAGDRLEALQNYDYAIKLGGERPLLRKVFSDRAALEIEIGQADEALRSLEYAGPSYQNALNRGLILVGREGYESALEQYRLAQKLRPAAAAPVYGMAVVAARQKDEAAVGDFLKQAVALDRSYAQRAVEDLEFQDYAQGKVFREALR